MIPGIDCRPLPECPEDGIDVRGEAFIPGVTCQIKKKSGFGGNPRINNIENPIVSQIRS